MRHGELARVWVISKGFCLVYTTPGVAWSSVHIVYTAGAFMDEKEGLERRYAGLGNRVWSVVGLQPWCSYFLQYDNNSPQNAISESHFFNPREDLKCL